MTDTPDKPVLSQATRKLENARLHTAGCHTREGLDATIAQYQDTDPRLLTLSKAPEWED